MMIIERSVYMEELGIIIDQDGNYMSFGKWKPRELRMDENQTDWHDDSFKCEIYPTEWFQNLNIPYIFSDKIGFHNQLDMFAKHGILVIVNNSEDDKNSLVVASPSNISSKQIQVLLDMKEKLINFENDNISFIDVLDVNEDYVVLDSFYHISDYYNYLENLLDQRKGPKF